jgi:hypothetical protein
MNTHNANPKSVFHSVLTLETMLSAAEKVEMMFSDD